MMNDQDRVSMFVGLAFILLFACGSAGVCRFHRPHSLKFWRIADLAIPLVLAALAVGTLGTLGNYPALEYFSPGSALITVALVIEGGTFAQMIRKSTLRLTGTFVGACVGLGGAWLVELVRGFWSPFILFSTLLTIFLGSALGRKKDDRYSYFFTCVSVTFSIAFYGFFTAGTRVAVGRVVSMFYAIAITGAVDIMWPMLCNNPLVFSLRGTTEISSKIMEHIVKHLDRMIVLNELMAQPPSQKPAAELWEGRTFPEDTREYFRMDDWDISVDKLRKEVVEKAAEKRIKSDIKICKLQKEADDMWEDLKFAHRVTCRRPPREAKYRISKKLHAVYGQVIALSRHMNYWGQSSERICKHFSSDIESVRGGFNDVGKLLIEIVGACKNRESEAGRLACTEACRRACTDLRKMSEQMRGCIERISTDDTDPCSHTGMWRFNVFITSLDLLAQELVLCTMWFQETFGEGFVHECPSDKGAQGSGKATTSSDASDFEKPDIVLPDMAVHGKVETEEALDSGYLLNELTGADHADPDQNQKFYEDYVV